MSQAKDFLSILQTDYHNFEKYFKSLLNNYSKLTNFLERILSVVPLELIVIFLLSILLFYILNSISKDTSKINFVVSVILSSVILYFLLKVGILNKKKLSDSLNRVFISPIIILTAVFTYYFIILGFQTLIQKYSKSRIYNAKSLEKSIFNLQITFNQLMNEYYTLADKNFDSEELKNKAADLEILSQRIQEILIPKRDMGSKKEVSETVPIPESDVRINSNV